MMRALSSAHCSDVRLYTLGIKIGTRTMSASVVELTSDFPCLADEMAERRPDMNIKLAAFTVSEKSINTNGTFAREDGAFAVRINP